MTWMNAFEIDNAVDSFDLEETPNLSKGARILLRLRNWTDRNSDGWPYWHKPSNSAAKLQGLLSERLYHGDGDDITEEQLKAALRPIKSFLTRQGVGHREIIPSENIVKIERSYLVRRVQVYEVDAEDLAGFDLDEDPHQYDERVCAVGRILSEVEDLIDNDELETRVLP